MAYENIVYEKKDHIGYITFNRPKVLNALNRKTVEELGDALIAAREDPDVRALILTGAGEKAFVAGADINELAQAKGANAAGLQNFMRNMGSSIGTSMVTTLIARRAQVHQAYLVRNVTPGHPTLDQTVAALAAHLATRGLDSAKAMSQAMARVYRETIAQATTLAYIDTFSVLAAGSAIMFLLSFALKKNDPAAGGEVAVG